MKSETITGKWDEIKGKAKQRWGKLTDDDLTVIGGKFDELVGKIKQRYGITKEEAEKQVREWQKSRA